MFKITKASMQKILLYVFTLFISVLLLACCSKTTSTEEKTEESIIRSDSNSYAQGFSIDYFETYTRVTVNNAWQKGVVLKKYYLVQDMQTATPSDGQKIRIPITSIVANSCSHFEFLSMLSENESIVGICSPERIYSPRILARYEDGKIENMGDAFAMNTEKIMLAKPDLIMVTGYEQMDETYARLEKTGMAVVVNNEWMEATSLGRAEWIKFMAAFFKKEKMADSIFATIEHNYKDMLALAATASPKPKIASGNSFKGTWYLPGGNSFMSALYKDAGGDYVFAADTSSGSLPLSFEIALKELRYCDVWLGSNATSLKGLMQLDARLSLFDAYKNKRVYNYNKRATSTGGNDYWESAIARPDILLKDLIKVMHPDLLPDYDLFYIHQLE